MRPKTPNLVCKYQYFAKQLPLGFMSQDILENSLEYYIIKKFLVHIYFVVEKMGIALYLRQHAQAHKRVNSHTHTRMYKKEKENNWFCSYFRGKWTWLPELKFRTRLFEFHIPLITRGKLGVQVFSLQLLVNSRSRGLFYPGLVTSLEERKFWIQTRFGERCALPGYSCPGDTTCFII